MTLKDEESGWVIERYINSELRYWDGRKIGDESFVTDSLEAIRFARSEDASKVLSWCLAGQGRVAEHVWTEQGEDSDNERLQQNTRAVAQG